MSADRECRVAIRFCEVVLEDIDLSKITALVVEDDKGDVAMITAYLRRLGIRAYVDRSGANTVELAKQLDPMPDIIFLDLNLPRKTGFDIIKEIRADDQLHNVPVVATSAMDPQVAIPRCKEAGFNGFFPKPLRREHLADRIQRVLHGQSVWETQ